MGVFESKNAGERWIKRMEGMKEVLMVVTLGMDPTQVIGAVCRHERRCV